MIPVTWVLIVVINAVIRHHWRRLNARGRLMLLSLLRYISACPVLYTSILTGCQPPVHSTTSSNVSYVDVIFYVNTNDFSMCSAYVNTICTSVFFSFSVVFYFILFFEPSKISYSYLLVTLRVHAYARKFFWNTFECEYPFFRNLLSASNYFNHYLYIRADSNVILSIVTAAIWEVTMLLQHKKTYVCLQAIEIHGPRTTLASEFSRFSHFTSNSLCVHITYFQHDGVVLCISQWHHFTSCIRSSFLFNSLNTPNQHTKTV